MLRPSASIRFVMRIQSGPLVAAQAIDPQIARDRINPGRRACASRIEIRRLSPNRQQRFLRDVFGYLCRRALRINIVLIRGA